MKYKLSNVSSEVAEILHSRGRRKDSFLIKIADSWEDIKNFSKRYKTELRLIDLSTETEGAEPLYIFSDNLGGYTSKGLRTSLQIS